MAGVEAPFAYLPCSRSRRCGWHPGSRRISPMPSPRPDWSPRRWSRSSLRIRVRQSSVVGRQLPTNGPAGLDPGSRAFRRSELAQFPADLEGIAGMLLVEHQDQGGDQQQADHGDARPEAGRPACRPALARADRSIAAAAARRLVEPFHGRRWRARLVIHSVATWQGQDPAMGACHWSAIGARKDNQAAAQAVLMPNPGPASPQSIGMHDGCCRSAGRIRERWIIPTF